MLDEVVVEEIDPDPTGLDAVLALLRGANEQYRAVLPPPAFEPYLAMVLDVRSRLASSTLLGVREDDDVIAVCTYFQDASLEGWGADHREAGVRAMAVDPGHRGRGLGRVLVEACAGRARSDGATALTLHTADWLPEAIALYERCGFVRDPQADLRASVMMPVPQEHDYVALAYRLELAADDSR